ncbi:diaminopimelate epimerase [Marmoricola endophyticus]|uniref:diaminopimelate epimerase n=1 Tax=Marmoricola endophyticus TaxID=2040280 RepID=UPI001E47ADC4|nr:diaminopimelate epimerase [Marmoricola endophyticus]
MELPVETPFVKGHGTENDFVLLPDANGALEVSPGQVAALCDRRVGLGADGVIRVVRTDATDDPAAVAARGEAIWFMDYRNADGSLSEMCGNGVRVLALYLATHADVDAREPLPIATRDGIKTVTFGEVGITVDMGTPSLLGETRVSVGEQSWTATHVDLGNPHAVALVEVGLDTLPTPLPAPVYDEATYPHGVNVELVSRVGAPEDHHVAMRVHERGSGETRSCGTGACAVLAAVATADEAPRGTTYVVDVPGGRLHLEWTEAGTVLMTGPAVLVAEGWVTLAEEAVAEPVEEPVAVPS